MSWKGNRVFDNGKSFIDWLDENFGSYVSRCISELHVHHTLKPNHSNSQSTLQLHKNMKNFHVRTNKWSDIGQHLTIGKDGKVVLGRSVKVSPASAKGYNGNGNWHPFMFEMIGNFDKGHDELKGEQLETVLEIGHYFHVKKGKPIKFHREMSSKTCPGSGINKSKFVDEVKSYKGKVTVSSESPKPSKKVSGGSLGLVDWMKTKGMDSSFYNRKKLADKYGIKKYKGTAEQNTKLLNVLKSNKTKPTSKANKVSSGKGGIEVGDTVTLSKTANRYATGQKIPASVKGKKYTVQQVKTDRILLKEIYSWVNKKDVSKGNKTKGNKAIVPYPGKSIELGSVGKDVERVQRAVKVNPDGVFGKKTRSAVIKYQKRHNLMPDGIVGPKTWNVMF